MFKQKTFPNNTLPPHILCFIYVPRQLDDELAELCAAFHQSRQTIASAQQELACDREVHLYSLAEKNQESVTQILTRILDDKKRSLPFLLSPHTDKKIERPRGLQVAVLDRSAEGCLCCALGQQTFQAGCAGSGDRARHPHRPSHQAIVFLPLLCIPTRVLRPSEEFAGIIGKQRRSKRASPHTQTSST